MIWDVEGARKRSVVVLEEFWVIVGQNPIQRDAPITCFIDRWMGWRIFAYKIDVNIEMKS